MDKNLENNFKKIGQNIRENSIVFSKNYKIFYKNLRKI